MCIPPFELSVNARKTESNAGIQKKPYSLGLRESTADLLIVRLYRT